jgi:IMP dehydrogenase/GMP reductase
MKIKKALTFDDVNIIPKYSEVASRKNVFTKSSVSTNFELDIPLIAAPMDTVCGSDMAIELGGGGALGCIHRFCSIEQQAAMVRDTWQILKFDGTEAPLVCAAVGATGDYEERTLALIKAGARIIVIDVAHGDHEHVVVAIKKLKKMSAVEGIKFDVVAGSIATAEAALRLIEAGADCLRVGVGGGSACETRIRTGIGVPQLQAVMDVADVSTVPIISDGGIRYPGDVAKALAAGADTVMIGGLFAGTDEAPGEIFISGQWPNNKRMKMYRGSASATAKLAVHGHAEHVEGASKLIEARGTVRTIVNDLMEGVRSSMSYVGAHNLVEFRRNAEFVRITTAGLNEAHPHMLR